MGVDTKSLPREKWDTWDPTLISEVMMMVVTMYTYSEVGYPAGFQL